MKTITTENSKYKSNMAYFIHHVITYIPIICSLLGGFLLSNQLLLRKNISPKTIYLGFIFSSICSIYTFSILKFNNINHLDLNTSIELFNEKLLFVRLSVFFLIVLGISSIIGLFLIGKNYQKEISLALFISIIALFSSIFSIRSEYVQSNWSFYSKQIK